MSRAIPPSRPYPTDWQSNTMAARGWSEDTRIDAYRLWIAGSMFGAALVASALYGAIGWVLKAAPEQVTND